MARFARVSTPIAKILGSPLPSPSCHNPSCSRAHLPGSVLSNSGHPTRPSCVLAALDTVKSVTYAPRVLHFSAFHFIIIDSYSHAIHNDNSIYMFCGPWKGQKQYEIWTSHDKNNQQQKRSMKDNNFEPGDGLVSSLDRDFPSFLLYCQSDHCQMFRPPCLVSSYTVV